jgi:hypothetical protein
MLNSKQRDTTRCHCSMTRNMYWFEVTRYHCTCFFTERIYTLEVANNSLFLQQRHNEKKRNNRVHCIAFLPFRCLDTRTCVLPVLFLVFDYFVVCVLKNVLGRFVFQRGYPSRCSTSCLCYSLLLLSSIICHLNCHTILILSRHNMQTRRQTRRDETSSETNPNPIRYDCRTRTRHQSRSAP